MLIFVNFGIPEIVLIILVIFANNRTLLELNAIFVTKKLR